MCVSDFHQEHMFYDIPVGFSAIKLGGNELNSSRIMDETSD